MKFNRRIFLPLTVALLPCFAWAQTVVPDSNEEDEIVADDDADDFDRAVRENPVIIPDEADDIDIPIPAFIKKGANHIIYNGADWTKLRSAFENSKNSQSYISVIVMCRRISIPGLRVNCSNTISEMRDEVSYLRLGYVGQTSRVTMCSRVGIHGIRCSS